MRQFSKELNLDALNEDYIEKKDFNSDEANEIMSVTRDILSVFDKRGTSIETAYLILASLTDAIYISALYGFSENEE